MDKRNRILLTVFVVAIGYILYSQVAYPRWIDPLLTIDDRIAEKTEELNKLEETEARVAHAKTVYRRLVSRTGSIDVVRVRNEVHGRLNSLIEKNQLQNTKVSPSRRAKVDKKTRLSRLSFDVSVEGELQSVVTFLQQIAELPHLCRINNPKITPVSSSSRNKDADLVGLKAKIEVLVLADQKMLGEKLKDEDLVQPVSFQRHLGRDYAMIWAAKPFIEYEKSRPKPARQDPSKVTKPPTKDEKPKTKPKSKRWKDASKLQLCMAWLVDDGMSRFDEVTLYDTKSKKDRYVRVGEDFDGGSLLYVHQRGVLVGREDGDYVYPIGEKLDRPIKAEDAVDYPELQLALERIREIRGENAGAWGRDAALDQETEPESDAGEIEPAPQTEKEPEVEGRRKRPSRSASDRKKRKPLKRITHRPRTKSKPAKKD